MAALCGYDVLLLDGEHGLFTQKDYLDTVQVLASTGALAIVRVPSHDPQALGQYMDIGVDGIVVPNVSTADQARTLANAMEYPPAGTRGFGAALHRATHYGLDLAAYLQAPRERVMLLPLIESAVGAANAEEILAIEGVDGVIIGPWDLSTSLGCTGDFSQPAYGQAVSRIERAARARGKILGTAPHPGYTIDALISRGHRLLILDDDISLVCEALTAKVKQAKASLDTAGSTQ